MHSTSTHKKSTHKCTLTALRKLSGLRKKAFRSGSTMECRNEKKDPLWISGSAKVTPSSTISCVDPSCDLGTGQNPGTPGEPQNSWDLWMFIPLKMYL